MEKTFGVSANSNSYQFRVQPKKIPPVHFPTKLDTHQSYSRQFNLRPGKFLPSKILPGIFLSIHFLTRYIPANSNSLHFRIQPKKILLCFVFHRENLLFNEIHIFLLFCQKIKMISLGPIYYIFRSRTPL